MRRAFSTRPRGSLIIAALLLFTVLLSLGLGLMSSQSARMKVARGQAESVQAKALCEAAWEDVRVKLGKDILFPRLVEGQTFFAYSEDMYAQVDGVETMVGMYTVIIDATISRDTRETDDLSQNTNVGIPRGLYQITCIGKVGSRTEAPVAERVMRYELVMAHPENPSNSFRVIRVEDSGSI